MRSPTEIVMNLHVWKRGPFRDGRTQRTSRPSLSLCRRRPQRSGKSGRDLRIFGPSGKRQAVARDAAVARDECRLADEPAFRRIGEEIEIASTAACARRSAARSPPPSPLDVEAARLRRLGVRAAEACDPRARKRIGGGATRSRSALASVGTQTSLHTPNFAVQAERHRLSGVARRHRRAGTPPRPLDERDADAVVVPRRGRISNIDAGDVLRAGKIEDRRHADLTRITPVGVPAGIDLDFNPARDLSRRRRARGAAGARRVASAQSEWAASAARWKKSAARSTMRSAIAAIGFDPSLDRCRRCTTSEARTPIQPGAGLVAFANEDSERLRKAFSTVSC